MSATLKQISLKSFHEIGTSASKRNVKKGRKIRRVERARATAFEVRNWKRRQEGWTV